MQLVYRTVQEEQLPVTPGGLVPLIQPPQGGKILVIGVRAKNIDCRVDVATSLIDYCTGAVIAIERRPQRLRIVDGWGEPEFPHTLGSFSNVPACPSRNLSRNVYDEPQILESTITDRDGRTQTATVSIVPFCSQPEFMTSCLCECHKNYTSTGCTPDAGVNVPPGTCPDAG